MKNRTDAARRRHGAWTAWTIAALATVAGFAVLRLGREGRRVGSLPDGPACHQQLTLLREHAARQAQAARRLDHDLRAPVGAMAVALELVRTTEDPALREEAMEVLVRQVGRMTTLTQRMHEISQEYKG